MKSRGKKEWTSLVTTQHPDFSPENLRAMRKALGMTQAELAKRAGVVQTHVSAFESGAKNVASEHTHRRIREALVMAEYDRIRDMGTTPKTETEKLNERIKYLEKELFVAQLGVKRLEKTNAELLSMNNELLTLHGWKIRNVVEDDAQREAEAKLMAKIGAEKIPPVEEETLRSEIADRGKKGKS